MQRFYIYLLISLLLCIVSNNINCFGAKSIEYAPQRIGNWENVTGVAVSPDETYMVLSMRVNDKGLLFESFYSDYSWSSPQPIDIINNYMEGVSDIGGPFLYYNSGILYYHANFPDSRGGYDIYYSVRTSNGWSKPVNMAYPVNTDADEFYPAMAPGSQKFFFSRDNTDADVRKPRRTPDCKTLYSIYKGSQGKWENPTPLHDVVNMACEYGLSVAKDGKTVFFSSVDQENFRDGYNIYFAREILRGAWVKPVLVENITNDETNINPVIAGENIYFIRQDESRRSIIGNLYKARLPDKFQPVSTVTSKGAVLMLEDDEPVLTKLTVFDPTTLKVLGEFYNEENTGNFEIPLLDNANYIVDVRTHGYSFASFQLDYRSNDKLLAPEVIRLFDEVELLLSVYDAEIFRPLDVDVWVKIVKSDNEKIIKASTVEPGVYSLVLPIGYEYIVNADSDGFTGVSFNFDLLDDIVFSQFHRNLLLQPIKQPVDFHVADSETGESLAADILITNLNREETIFFSSQDVINGSVRAMLREGDDYEFTVTGAQGYSFHNQVFSVSEDEEILIDVDLVPLRAQTAIRLNNVYFATNSAELTSESFPELDRVVNLIIDNPMIVIEISAHTCDLGSVAYNDLLSERRAQSVVSYLFDNDVPDQHIVAKGYGMHSPVVPNISDENRAMNRRVEFKVIDIREAELELDQDPGTVLDGDMGNEEIEKEIEQKVE